jgi:CYTH domain-containing protein
MKYGYVERERRFLVKTLPPEVNLQQDYRRIFDRYFPNTFLRLREITTPEGQLIQQKFARKEAAGDSSRHAHITNLYLTSDEHNLLATLRGMDLHKRRYHYPYLEHVIGIDVFDGQLTGLILAEVEFISDEVMAQFQPPGFCTIEVTDDLFFSGGHLATVQADVLRPALQIHFQSIPQSRST